MSESIEAPDAPLQAAVDVARAAATETAAPDPVGEHLGVVSDGERMVSHLFGCTKPGYLGWYWSVSISRAPDSDSATVNDVVLLPGDEAITAPVWTPYKDRIRPGDLSPGDVLPPEDDDLRLVPSWTAGDGDEQTPDRFFAREVGLGRPWVLSIEGREMAADRWHDGEQGPDTPMAKEATGVCGGCGFLISLAGPLSDRFGVCGNGMANADGRVVSVEHGCGAHSGARLKRSASAPQLPSPVLDTITNDVMEPVVPEPVEIEPVEIEPAEVVEDEVVASAETPNVSQDEQPDEQSSETPETSHAPDPATADAVESVESVETADLSDPPAEQDAEPTE